MAAKTKASANGTAPIDFSTWTPAKRRYDWFEMDQPEGEDGEPFRIRVQRLTQAEVDEIPEGNALMKDVIRDFRRYIVAWNLTAQTDAGDVVPVMPPSEMDEASIEAVIEHILIYEQVRWMYGALKAGDTLKVLAEKKALLRSATTPESPPDED